MINYYFFLFSAQEQSAGEGRAGGMCMCVGKGGLIKTRAFPYSLAQAEAEGGTDDERIKGRTEIKGSE